jgi:acyl-coenzyme A synthetase/AMP-(fatty) acid ligase
MDPRDRSLSGFTLASRMDVRTIANLILHDTSEANAAVPKPLIPTDRAETARPRLRRSIEAAAFSAACQPGDAPRPRPHFVCSSSGRTGTPKGVIASRAARIRAASRSSACPHL